MLAKLIKELEASPSAGADVRLSVRDGQRYWPAGTVIDDPRAYRLVQMGVAEPADAECAVAANMTTESMKRAQMHQELVAKGIHPDDYQRYIDGELLGYDEAGDDIPGPNAKDGENDDDD